LPADVAGVALAAGALLLFSTNIVIMRFAMAKLDLDVGFVIAMIVNLLVCALFLAVQVAWRGAVPTWNGIAFAMFAFAGVFSTYLGRWFLYESVARLGPTKASTFQVSSPLFAVAIAWVFLDEALSPTAIAGMAIAIGGLVFLGSMAKRKSAASAPSVREDPPRARTRVRTAAFMQSGLLLGVGSSLAYAVGNVLRAAAVRRWPEAIAGALIGAAAGVVLQFATDRGSLRRLDAIRHASRVGVALYTLCGVLTITGQTLVIASMAYIPVSFTALITLCTPLLVFPVSYFLLHNEEQLTWSTLVGCLITLAGMAVLILNRAG
jgi:drug/metabolite transporter (DMT)-like permease